MARRRLAAGSPSCCYCKRQLTPAQPETGTSFTLDHVRALSLDRIHGGYKRVPCCRKCNQLKGDLPAHDWFWFTGRFARWWKLFDTADQVVQAVMDEHRRRAYARAAALGVSTMKGMMR